MLAINCFKVFPKANPQLFQDQRYGRWVREVMVLTRKTKLENGGK